jgi:alpha-L-fucosidase
MPSLPELPRRHVLGLAAGATTLGLVAPARAADTGHSSHSPAGAETDAAATDAAMVRAADAASGALAPPVPAPAPIPVSLAALFNNDALDTAAARDGDFDGSGYSFPADALPADGLVTVGGVPYRLGSAAAGAKNDIVALGQAVPLPSGRYLSLLFLVAGSYGTASGQATVTYADGSTSTATLTAPDWYSSGDLTFPYRYAPGGGTDQHPVSLAAAEVWTYPDRDAVSVTLPNLAAPAPNVTSLHVFALSLQPLAQGTAAVLRDARSTTSMLHDAGPQSVEATLLNAGTTWLTAADAVSVGVEVPGARTVAPAQVTLLAPGEQARLRIGLAPGAGVAAGTAATGAVRATARGATLAVATGPLTLGVADYRPTDASLAAHQAPYWFDDAKFGIFIHWGVYSVPAWGPVGQEYAEWYWNNMQSPSDPTYAYHAATYGESFTYDDFIPRFTAANFDPRAWVQLISDAGAQYYVLTSKHHEGFALWDSKVTGRTAVQLGPHRDLVGELFAASRRYTPHLRNGLYYSLPEWFNPDNPWMGHAPRNPYTLAPVPYTGYQAGRDYVKDYQTPQVLELINGYDPDVIWYDIGGANDTRDALTAYFNHAKNRARPKDVTVDDRGGIPAHDYTTPEYATYGNTVTAKWEASRGLDPRSYGYNSATPDSLYMTAEQVVQTLVDIVSKNGNFLLDIGPRADGTIPEIMQQRLRETGAWLRVNGEAIYGTTYWSRMAQAGDLRFTVRQNQAFYIISLTAPGNRVTVPAPVPIRPQDRVTLLGYRGGPLAWSRDGGVLSIQVPAAAQATGQYAWVFKVAWA